MQMTGVELEEAKLLDFEIASEAYERKIGIKPLFMAPPAWY